MVVPVVVGVAAPILLETVLTAELGRRASPSPKIRPGEFLRTALEIQALSEQGLTPVLSSDPFSQNLVLSTESQSAGLFNLLGERFARTALAGTPEESAALLRAREEFVESRRVGTPPEASAPTVRDQVVAALSTTTGKVVGPGVVAKKSSSLAVSRRLGGPCAAANTGFSRLTCARGGFS